jgi:hypothetical protein
MEVLKETPSELAVQARPGIRLLAAGGVMFCLVGLLIVAMTQTMVVLNCHRSGPREGVIELSSQALFGSKVGRTRLEDVTDVVIATGPSRGSRGVVIRTKEGDLSLAALSSGRANQLAAQLRGFIDDPAAPGLTIRQDNRLFAFTMGPAMVLVGLFLFALTSQRVSYTLDKAAGRVLMERKSIFGTRKAEYPMNQIADVRTQWVGYRKRAAVVYLVLRSGERIHAGWPDRAGTVARIRAFLGFAT